ncbi:hypothetical protein BH11VER1_BH11VER1_04110 [soil metagenome]
MLWKTLSGLSAIALFVGLWFSYQTRLALDEEHKLATRAKANLSSTQKKYEEATVIKATKTTELADLEKQRDDTKAQVATVNTEIEQKIAETEVIKKQLDEVTKQLTQLKDQVAKAGDIKKLMADVEDLTKQRQAAEAAIANQQQQLALAEQKLTGVLAEVSRLQDLDKRQRSGIVEPDFTARVSQVFLGYGFVILNKGNAGGLPVNAILDVKRGKDVVARLKVRDVETSMAVADLVPGSLAAGNAVRMGDLVVPSPRARENKGAAPAPAAPPAGAPPAAAPGMADPFAAPAGGMAPAAPAAPAAPDPFAAPPAAMAPAAGAPPAAMAPAAGATPAAPAVVDPFAPPK